MLTPVQIIDNGANIILLQGTKESVFPKDTTEVQLPEATSAFFRLIRMDNNVGIDINFADVSNPVAADIGALVDLIEIMLSGDEGTGSEFPLLSRFLDLTGDGSGSIQGAINAAAATTFLIKTAAGEIFRINSF